MKAMHMGALDLVNFFVENNQEKKRMRLFSTPVGSAPSDI